MFLHWELCEAKKLDLPCKVHPWEENWDHPYKRTYFEINIALLLVGTEQGFWRSVELVECYQDQLASSHPRSQGPAWQVEPPGLANGCPVMVQEWWINNIMLRVPEWTIAISHEPSSVSFEWLTIVSVWRLWDCEWVTMRQIPGGSAPAQCESGPPHTWIVNPPSTSTYLASTNPDMWLSQPCSTTSILDPGNKYSHLETFSWEGQIALNQGGRGSSLLPQEQLISSYPENVNLNRTNFHPESF